MKVHIITFGCSANQGDSEMMAGLLEKAGHEIVKDIEKSDVVLINTCIVKGHTESKVKTAIRNLQQKFPNKRQVIAGCMPAAELNLLREIAPNASLISPQNVNNVVEVVERSFETILLTKRVQKPKLNLPKIRKNRIINITQISEGCTGSCSYCIVKLAKGNLFSYPREEILKEIKTALKEGCREIWLTSQDNSAYGLDSGTNIVQLLGELTKMDGSFYIRTGMMNPNHILPFLGELIKIYKNKKVFRFLHIPVQSANNRILKQMNRNYKAEDFKKIIKSFRKEIPDITVSTDIICGFPSETENEFEDSLKLIKEIKPDVLNISKFWARPGTKAAKMEKQIPGREIKKRSKRLAEMFRKIALENNKEWIGWRGRIIIDEKAENGFVGRNLSYKPVVVKSRKNLFGKEIAVEIKEARMHCLIGEIVRQPF